MAEVFGFKFDNLSGKAQRYRRNRLCPYNNRVPSCTKDKAKDPLGVCSIFHNDSPVITCPVRFREDWIIAEDAAEFFFDQGSAWTTINEVNLRDREDKSAGNIDMVLVSYDETGKILEFGSLEIQAVYISGNIRTPFNSYVSENNKKTFDWSSRPNYPKPDFLSSSCKRLIPQVLYKGGIFHSWGRKQAVALQSSFFETLPAIPEVEKERAEVAWFLYDLLYDKKDNVFKLNRKDVVYTLFEPSLQRIINPEPGNVKDFIEFLQIKLDEKLDGEEPETKTLGQNGIV